VAAERPHPLWGSTTADTASVVKLRRRVCLETRQLALDRRVDVLKPAPDVPSDLRVHEHGGQVDEHVHVAHAIHPGGRAEQVPQITVGGEQSRVERDQRWSVSGYRLAGGHLEDGVRVFQMSLDVLQHSVPACGTSDRQRAHHALQHHLKRGNDGRGRVLYAQRPARQGRLRVLHYGPHPDGHARDQHG